MRDAGPAVRICTEAGCGSASPTRRSVLPPSNAPQVGSNRHAHPTDPMTKCPARLWIVGRSAPCGPDDAAALCRRGCLPSGCETETDHLSKRGTTAVECLEAGGGRLPKAGGGTRRDRHSFSKLGRLFSTSNFQSSGRCFDERFDGGAWPRTSKCGVAANTGFVAPGAPPPHHHHKKTRGPN
jgi:hypothetical protein